MNFLQSLFGWTDRFSQANERSAKAAEDVAAMMEAVRDRLAERLGVEPTTSAPALADETDGKRKRKSA